MYAKLAKCVFMSVWDVKGRRVSSVPVFEPGTDPRNAAGPLWEGGQLWDVRHGASAWRPIGGVAARHGAMKSTGRLFGTAWFDHRPGKRQRGFHVADQQHPIGFGTRSVSSGLGIRN